MSILAYFYQSLIETLKDKAAVTVIVGGVVFYSFLYSTPYAVDVPVNLPVAIVDLDHSAFSRHLTRAVNATKGAYANSYNSLAAARLALERDEASGILLISEGTERDLLAGRIPNLELYANGAYLIKNSAVSNAVGEVVTALAREAGYRPMGAGEAGRMPIELVQRPLYNTRESYAGYVIPALATIVLHQTLLIGILIMTIGRRERRGRVRLGGRELIGLTGAYVFLGCTMGGYYYSYGFCLGDYPRAANLGGLTLALLLLTTAVSFLGLFLGSFFKLREQGLQIIIPVSLPVFFMSGSAWPFSLMPDWLVVLGKLIPAVPGVQVMIKFNQVGAGLSEAGPELLNLAALVLLYGLLAWFRLVRLKGQG